MFKKIQLAIKATKLYQKKTQAKNYLEQLTVKFQMDEFEDEIVDLAFKGKLSTSEVQKLQSILECGEIK